ncbi:cysteine--tRNA ligase, partial [candidate division WOR-3 bacterium]|nr:cysteine--tRNA ligase [candidate division WOR-3 bacterium]
MRLFNTLQGKKQEFVPLKKGKVGIYFCGMTLQESPHVGHMRAIISADILHRYLLYKGYDVTLLINFTDIDDKVIEKSFEEGIDYREITARYEEEFLEASNWLNILPATVYPRATQHIQEIIELIQRIIEKGYAYEVEGNVYFSVKKFKDYGKLSGKNIDQLRSGARVDIDEKKRDPLDFSLWKKAKKGEPYWLSPWGKGRPGWHIECSSMSMHYLGETFDIHGGGNDLIFPHHENEIAQSESATGKPFAKYWIHNGMLTLRGDKMSKSLKNFVPILDMKGSISPNAIRYYILGTHYRSPLEYNDKIINQAKNGWERIKVFLSSVPDSDNKVLQETRDKFEEYMDDDLNT